MDDAPRVLVVDDEAPIRLLCRVNLEAAGMVVHEAGDGVAGHQDVLRMEVPVADDTADRLGRAVREEPLHRAGEPLDGTAGDSLAEVGQHAVKARHLAAAFLPHRAEQRLGVEIVEPELRPSEDAGNVELPHLEHRPAWRPLHDEKGPVQDGRVRAGGQDARRWVAQRGDRVLHGSLAKRPRRVVLRPEQPEDQGPGERRRRAGQPRRRRCCANARC